MNFLRIYLRVLGLLAPEARLAVALALANIVLAMATFIEPILLGHIIDALSGTLPASLNGAAAVLAPLIGAWVGFGLFIIAASAMVAWFSDRLAHRRRNLVLADFFEHVLQLPLSYHAGAHSGRQLKIMLAGTDTLWWLWVSFFREHFAAFVFIIVLLPASLYLNWRLALPLLALCVVFTGGDDCGGAHAPTLCSRRSRSIIPISPRTPPTRSATSPWCRATCASRAKCRRCARW